MFWLLFLLQFMLFVSHNGDVSPQNIICHCRQTCISVRCLVWVFAMVDHCVLSDPLCRSVSDERLFVIGCVVCWIKYCIFNLLHRTDYVYTFYLCLMVFVLQLLRALLSLSWSRIIGCDCIEFHNAFSYAILVLRNKYVICFIVFLVQSLCRLCDQYEKFALNNGNCVT